MTIDPNKIPSYLNTSILKTLCHIADSESVVTLSELSRHLGISTAAMTGLADAAENRGLARRARAACDRRVILLELTRSGRDLVESLRPTPETTALPA